MNVTGRTDILGGLAAIAAGLILAYFLIGRSWATIQSQRAELTRLSEQAEALTGLQLALQEAEVALRAARSQEGVLNPVPQRMEFAAFFQEIQERGLAAGLQVQRLQHTPGPANERFLTLNVTLTAEGDFTSVYGFIHGLHQMRRLVNIERLRVVATEDPGVCEAEVVMRIYAAQPGGSAS